MKAMLRDKYQTPGKLPSEKPHTSDTVKSGFSSDTRKKMLSNKKHSVTAGGPKDELVSIGGDKANLKELQAQNAQQMRRLFGTEFIIENTLKMLDTNPWDDLGDWPADAEIYKGMRLSQSKMKNEVDLREPRTINYDGRRAGYPFFSTELGWHSTKKQMRRSDIEELGEGTNLYFKFLKYFMLIFFFCLVFSAPAAAIFMSGGNYDSITNQIKYLTGLTTLGNLGPYTQMICASAYMPETFNGASYINFECPHGSTVVNLQHFGFAY